jgi:hypothetical protein
LSALPKLLTPVSSLSKIKSASACLSLSSNSKSIPSTALKPSIWSVIVSTKLFHC